MQELSYLKLHPRDQDENRLLLLKGERLYEESTGRVRDAIDVWLREFEEALNDRSRQNIDAARNLLKSRLKQLEEEW